MSINFFDEDVGFISGNKILKTTNSGQDWFVVNQNSSWDISIINRNTIISVGPDGSIYKSLDNGDTWDKKTSGTNKILTGTVFLNENYGYAVGWDGIILQSDDGGETWANIFSSTNEILWDVEFISDDIGYIVGDSGTILYTENTGVNWSFQKSSTQEDLHSIFFTDFKTGYIVGSSETVLKTVNGGITSIEKPDSKLPRSINLLQNFPNPFNPRTSIKFEINESAFVTIKVYNVLGKEVTTLLKEELKMGTYSIDFDGSNLSSGIYLCVLKTSNNYAAIKMTLLK